MHKVIFSNMRSAGTVFNQTNTKNKTFGGYYTPAHIDAKGKAINARWECSCIYQDLTTNQPVTIKLVAWNGHNVIPGKGMADICAKHISVGKKITGEAAIRQYTSRVFSKTGEMAVDSKKQPITVEKLFYMLIPGSLEFGEDSQKTIQIEINNFQRLQKTTSNFFRIRPPQWNIPGTSDHLYWVNTILPWRTAQFYKGQTNRYGYAKVMIPEGATIR